MKSRFVIIVAMLIMLTGCSTMKDVGVGMRVGGGFGGVGLLGSIIEAAADLGEGTPSPLPEKTDNEKTQIINAVVADFKMHVKNRKGRFMSPQEETYLYCADMEAKISNGGFQLKTETGLLNVKSDPFNGGCSGFLIFYSEQIMTETD